MIDEINKKTQSVMVGRFQIEPDLATPEVVRPALFVHPLEGAQY
jgi:hypothetical protein